MLTKTPFHRFGNDNPWESKWNRTSYRWPGSSMELGTSHHLNFDFCMEKEVQSNATGGLKFFWLIVLHNRVILQSVLCTQSKKINWPFFSVLSFWNVLSHTIHHTTVVREWTEGGSGSTKSMANFLPSIPLYTKFSFSVPFKWLKKYGSQTVWKSLEFSS